jgi:cell division protein FtsW
VKRAQLESNVLVLVTLALTAFGLVMVYSATSARAVDGGNGRPMEYLLRQALFAGLGLVALLVAARTPYEFWRRIAPSFLLVSLVLLAGVLVLGLYLPQGLKDLFGAAAGLVGGGWEAP